jgi:Fe-S oxidoreductase/nitrate reductase gamma subunit
MLSFWEKVLFAFVILAAFLAFALPILLRYRIIRRGKPEMRLGHLARRTGDALAKVFLQRCTLRSERVFTGLMHVFIFYGALTFDTMTINHTLEGFIDKFYLFGQTNFGLFFSLVVDVFAILVPVGVVFFIIRRFVIRPKAYRTTLLDSGLIYFFLIAVTLSYVYFEALAIVSHPDNARLSFLGSYLAGHIQAFGPQPEVTAFHLHLSWWLHVLLVYGFIAYVPHSKYLHMFTGPMNVFFRPERPSGEIQALDIENAEVFGAEKAGDLTWKDFLDAFACMECGRCQDACPAYASDKPLSPKMIVFNLEKHLLEEKKKLLAGNLKEMPPLLPGVYSEGEIWTCTTCGACQHVCPVEIEHIRKIVGVRQSEVLNRGRFPQELNLFFRNLETNSNPWGVGFSKRTDWAESLDLPLMADRKSADYLFWVGCAGSFDEEGQRISRAMVSLLNKAGLDFAVLGTEEKCCGDPARRLGQEYLFQTLAQENMGLFLKYNVRKLITFCPHGFNTFKNEYHRLLRLLPSFSEQERAQLAKIEIVPHAVLLNRLVREGGLSPKPGLAESLTYHDSCYLGRHNGIVREPRELLSRLSPQKFTELGRSREHSFCCGAGGGLMWTEENLGRRINLIRTDEIIGTGAGVAATSCPFCLSMLKDGLKDRERTDIAIKDIAQLLAESLED